MTTEIQSGVPQQSGEPTDRRMGEAALGPRCDSSQAPGRLAAIDAFRGLVMVLMVSAGLRITEVVRSFDRNPDWGHFKTPLWEQLAFHTDHVKWVGGSLWDLIQPSFMFLVGTSLAFSIANRRAKGQSFGRMLVHAILRSIVLVFLGIFLISNWSPRTDWSFVNVLTQIGLGYTFLFLLGWLKPRWQLAAAVAVLALYWGAFALYPAPARDLDLKTVELPSDWQRLEGFASHWEKNTNLAARVDGWFLNQFPQPARKNAPSEPDGSAPRNFKFNSGGYQTLNFVPSLATMLFGLLAGELLRGRRSAGVKFGVCLAAGVAGLAIGWWLGWLGICPVVKRIWTPSWAIYSAGWAFVLLAMFYLIIEMARIKFWAYPLVVVGANSIAIYGLSMLLKSWVKESLTRHFGATVYESFGKAWAPMAEAGFFLIFCWVVCWWMYRKKIFVKI
jgi:predicted acyltransferase